MITKTLADIFWLSNSNFRSISLSRKNSRNKAYLQRSKSVFQQQLILPSITSKTDCLISFFLKLTILNCSCNAMWSHVMFIKKFCIILTWKCDATNVCKQVHSLQWNVSLFYVVHFAKISAFTIVAHLQFAFKMWLSFSHSLNFIKLTSVDNLLWYHWLNSLRFWLVVTWKTSKFFNWKMRFSRPLAVSFIRDNCEFWFMYHLDILDRLIFKMKTDKT